MAQVEQKPEGQPNKHGLDTIYDLKDIIFLVIPSQAVIERLPYTGKYKSILNNIASDMDQLKINEKARMTCVLGINIRKLSQEYRYISNNRMACINYVLTK